jgi:hypothetical protein
VEDRKHWLGWGGPFFCTKWLLDNRNFVRYTRRKAVLQKFLPAKSFARVPLVLRRNFSGTYDADSVA